jgi:CelD/BcsL family acetyltransferase involved in cellulose biosynthesis
MNSNIEVKLYCSFEELATLQQRWDDLAASVGSEIFLTYDWCRIWWKYYGKNRDLRVWVFQKGTDLVGIVPLFLERIGLGPVSVRAAKLVGSDHTMAQFSLPIVRDHIPEVIEGLSEPLLKEKWDIMHIGPLAGLYSHYDALREALQGAFGGECGISCKEKQVQTYFFVAGTWEAQLASLSKNERKNIKRKCRVLKEVLQSRPGELASDLATMENVDDMFLGFVHMHQQHWQKRGKLGHFGDWPDSFDFHREMAPAQLKHDRLRLMRIHWGECCLAYEYTYRFGEKYFAFLNSRTDLEDLADANVGTTIFAEQMKMAMSENVRYIDDMRAKYDYKLRLGGKLFPMRDIYISRKQPFSLARVHVFRLLSKLLHLCYYKIWFIRIAQRLPLRRGCLWRIWIRSNAFAQ